MSIDHQQHTAPAPPKGGEPAADSPAVQANGQSRATDVSPKRMLIVFAMVIVLPCVGLAIAVEILAALVHVFSR